MSWDDDLWKAAAREYHASREREPPPSLEPGPDRYSEDALASRFTERHGQELRYVAAWGRWLWWDGQRWHPEDTLRTFDAARVICREASQELRSKSKSLAAKIARASTVAAIERLVRADRAHAATIDEWDANTWLLNTPAGTIDLRSGKMSSPQCDDYITKITAISPGGDCPRWRGFLDRITNGDSELQRYLQRVAGYALTGSTREHAIFFCHGVGANGKSTLVTALANIFNDYARTAPIEAFTISGQDRHPTELAMLRGARLVIATETEEGRR
jgi:putative DNA primase/helicase